MNSNSIILYALASAEKQYRPISYYCIFEGNFSIAEMMYRASLLKSRNPEIEHIFVIDNRKGLRKDYRETKEELTVESGLRFYQTLEKYGHRIDI